MNEIARIGFSVPTGELEKGAAALRAIVPAAKQAETGVNKFNAAAAGLAGLPGKAKPAASGMEQVAAAARGVTGATTGMSKAVLGAGTAMGTVQAAAAGVTGSMTVMGNAMQQVNAKSALAKATLDAYQNSLAQLPAAATAASSSLNRLGAAANDNINRLQSTPGNIAAQFQDIGVTAAAGMSPLLIALQQGTQLSSAMQGGIGNLLAGFRQLFNMTTVLTVGVVGLVAAGLQMVDWMRVAETLVVGLAEFVARYSDVLLYAGTVALIAFGPAILSAIGSMAASIGGALVTAVSTATMAMVSFSLANPFTALALGIAVVIGAMIALNDTFGGVFTRILKTVNYVANAIIRAFATAFNATLQMAQTLANGIVAAFNGLSGLLGFGELGTVDLSGFKIDVSPGRNFVGDIASAVGGMASRAVDAARGLFAPDPAVAKAAGGGSASASRAAGGMSDADRELKAYEELTLRAAVRVKEIQDEAKALGMTQEAARAFRNEQDLLNQASERGITLDAERRNELKLLSMAMTDAQIAVETKKATVAFNEQMIALGQQRDLIGLTGEALEFATQRQRLLNDAIEAGIPITDAYNKLLDERAAALAQAEMGNRSAQFMARFTQDMEVQNLALSRQRGELGLVGPALEAYRIETELLVDAMRQGITLGPQDIALIREKAGAFAEVNEQVTRQRELIDFAQNATEGFFQDMFNGLRQGQSLWETFGNAVMRIVDGIIQQLIRMAMQDAFGALFGQITGSQVASLTNSARATIDANPDLFARGGAFGNGVQMFAAGGAFTNGIYNNPTMFKFAKGGAFGVMGEAGPEAVMPLKRGSDGSLGVEVQAMEPQTVLVRVVTDDERFNAYVDSRIDVQSPGIAQAGAEISKSEEAFMKTRKLVRS